MGEMMQRLMKELCLSQTELADRLGVPYDTVRGWASGRADPSPDNRRRLVSFIHEHASRLVESVGAVRSMSGIEYRYLAEKLQAAVSILMLPVRMADRAIADAFHEYTLGMTHFGPLPDEHAENLRKKIEAAMDTRGVEDEGDGTWLARARLMSEEEQAAFSGAIHQLAMWADQRFWGGEED